MRLSTRDVLLKTAAGTPTVSHSMQGRLYLSRSGWLLLHVPNSLMYGIFATIREPGVELPPSSNGSMPNAHITVMRPEELKQLGGANKVTERGQEFSYILGPLVTIVPSGWDDISRVYMVSVASPELSKLRRSYGLSSLPRGGKHSFHITIAVRRKHVLNSGTTSKDVESIPAALLKSTPKITPFDTAEEDGQRIRVKQAAIRGIPDPQDYGDLSQLPVGQLVDLVLQEHAATRAGSHVDVRIGSKPTGLFSWATRKDFPSSGKRTALWRQPLHSYEWGDFQGTIGPGGYGAGTVRRKYRGKLLITSASPDKITFSTADARYPERFLLIKPKIFKERGWLLINVTPQPKDVLPYKKVHYIRIPADRVEGLLKEIKDGDSVQAKIDGASSLIQLLHNGVEVTSYRATKEGNPLVHSERVFHGRPKVDIPPELVGTVMKGELYGMQHGKNGLRAIPPQELGGLLNATLANSLEAQKAKNIKLRTMLYDIQRLGRKDVDFSNVPYRERMQMLRGVLQHLPADVFHLTEEATTAEDAQKLWTDIASGKHPLTGEGIVIHPAVGKPAKAKLLDEQDVYITDVFPGKGKYKGTGAGGFVYSVTPGGVPVGRVGTGFSDNFRRELLSDPAAFVGRTARVRSQGAFPVTGALRAPAFLALHEDL